MDAKTQQAFLAAYDEYAEAIYQHCFFRVFSAECAEELVQETYLRAWDYCRRGEMVENWRAFLYRTATNLIIDDARKQKRNPTDSLEALLEEDRMAEPANPDRSALERQVLWKQVRSVFDRLPERERELLVLRFVDDLDPREIAGILGTTANSVSVQLNHALKKVRQLL